MESQKKKTEGRVAASTQWQALIFLYLDVLSVVTEIAPVRSKRQERPHIMLVQVEI